MIVTVTANPSIDRTVTLDDRLQRGTVLRAAGSSNDPGGKGVNVSRALAAANRDTIALLPGNPDDPLLTAMTTAGITYRAVPTSGRARTNITVTEPDGTTTKINEPGPATPESTLRAMEADIVALAQNAQWVVLSGSLPPLVPASWYADVVVTLRSALTGTQCKVAVDTSDAPLAALAGRFPESAPDLIKPNGEELAHIAGIAPHLLESDALAGDTTATVDAARQLLADGVGAVLATLGAAGAVLVTPAGAWRATAPRIVARSTVGAGDSSLAGYLAAQLDGADPATCLCTAVAYGSAAASLPGTSAPSPEQVDVDSVVVTELAPATDLA
ncbi:1-phosphofructokinase family hexose kinase [Rhodococcus sp. NPDC058521]|uniref:1-phosphofructokinase family hexose kinase n=1 Tax=Rhodococcus sp. NPDC058521 TaxID=3346536 RepID=UPI003669C88C